MLLSHRHRYLFVHIAKTGGTSVRSILGRNRWQEPLFWPGWVCGRISQVCQHRIGSRIPRHAPAAVAREMLPPTLFEEFFKFAFVRNPWDRLVSGYHHFLRDRYALLDENQIRDFSGFVDWMLRVEPETTSRAALVRALQRPQHEYLVDWHGRLLVDFVGHYERLEEDFDNVVRRLQLRSLRLPHKRRSERRRDYRTMYSDVLAERVGRFYAADLMAYGYVFDRQAA